VTRSRPNTSTLWSAPILSLLKLNFDGRERWEILATVGNLSCEITLVIYVVAAGMKQRAGFAWLEVEEDSTCLSGLKSIKEAGYDSLVVKGGLSSIDPNA